MSDKPHVPDDFEEAERYQRLFVTPMIDAVRTEMKTTLSPIVANQEEIKAVQANQAARLDKVEGSQSKALVGYGVFAAGLSVALAAGWDFVKGMFR